MKFAVNLNKCQNHGQCTYAAPEVFSLDDDGQLAFRSVATDEYVSTEVPKDREEEIDEAIDMCPVQAVRRLDPLG